MESFLDAWKSVSDYCKDHMHEVAFNVWIKIIKPVSLEDGQAVLSVRTHFQKDIIEKNYMDLLNSAFEQTLGFQPPIVLITEEDQTEGQPSPLENEPPRQTKVLNGDRSTLEYTFDNFIVGASNKFAYAASQAVATNPAGAYNPLFIYGGSGLGKTHLLYAICNEIYKNFNDINIVYIKGDDFTNELVEAIYNKTTNSFHNKYRQADVLLVDDIQFIAGKLQTQEEFFHTFDSLFQAGKQIVLVSDRPPKEIATLEERLRTRFEWGLLADVQPPDLETRVAIIKRKAEALDIAIPDELCMFIANRLKTNIRQLEGAVKKMKAYQQLAGEAPSILSAQNAIRDVLNDNQPIPVTIDRILTEVSRTCMVTPEEIKSNKRSAQISNARQIAIYVVREITQMSQSAIGEKFGGRDHSTINYAIQQVEKNMQKDPSYRATIDDIIKNIREK